jgi:bis(5'-nucleosyl)-tetraphosphatase (symmetrical)
MCHVENAHCLVHAGLLPQWTVADAQALAGEVESALCAPDWRAFLANMWGSKPAAWSDELTGWPRLRVIVNAMTRLRFCTPEGVMDFHAKGGLDNTPTGHAPWFEAPDRRSADTTLVTGHWSALGLKILPNLLALDSGCLWGGALTAVRLEDRAVFQVSCSDEEIRA